MAIKALFYDEEGGVHRSEETLEEMFTMRRHRERITVTQVFFGAERKKRKRPSESVQRIFGHINTTRFKKR